MQEILNTINSFSEVYNIPWSNSENSFLNNFRITPINLKSPERSYSHLWRINTKNVKQDLFLDCLSQDEKIKYFKIVPYNVKTLKVKSRILLRLILSAYLNKPPKEISFLYGKNGKPFLKNDIAKIHFNISHSGDHLVILIDSKHQIGIDIETELRSSEVSLKMAKRFFNQEEYQLLKSLKGKQQSILFNKLWTLKEAFLKSMGKGVFFIDQCPNFYFIKKNLSESYIEYYHTKNHDSFLFCNDKICVSTSRHIN